MKFDFAAVPPKIIFPRVCHECGSEDLFTVRHSVHTCKRCRAIQDEFGLPIGKHEKRMAKARREVDAFFNGEKK